MTEDLYYIWLSLACGAGSPVPQKLLTVFETAQKIYEAGEEELKIKCNFEIEEHIFARLTDKNTDESSKILEFCSRNNVSVLSCDSKLYPKRLKSIRSFPVVLYYKGRLPDIDDNLCVAMVGTRKMTNYGKMSAYDLARELASCGAVIVSGMANGIDSASHKGCLIAGGFTIAVFGCGIDRVYPPDNKVLMDKIIEKGLVMTEYAPGSEPKGAHFPVRNRIISGLSQAVLVVEADNKSGALITAKTALFQGRELYAVPGNITSPNSWGTNGLLKNQAGMVTDAYDILSEYEHLYSHRINIEKSRYNNNKINYYKNKTENRDISGKSKEKYSLGNGNVSSTVGNDIVNKMANKIKESESNINNTDSINNIDNIKEELTISEKLSALKIILNETEMKVFEIFYSRKDEKLHPDDISGDNMPITDVIKTLTFLEIYGIITSVPGDYYKISDNFINL